MRCGLLSFAIGAWQFRMRQLRKEFSAVVEERMRLSREIHDTLLQSFVGIGLQLDSVSHDLRDGSSRVRAQLARMRKEIEESVIEAAAVHLGLRLPRIRKNGLVGRPARRGNQLTPESRVRG